MIRKLHWILGIGAGLSLVLGMVFKLVFALAGRVIQVSPGAFLRFTAVCCIASIALSMIEISGKLKGPS